MSFEQGEKMINLKGYQINENNLIMALQEMLLEDVEVQINQLKFQFDLENLQKEELQKLLLLH